jgi:hypothetical protein
MRTTMTDRPAGPGLNLNIRATWAVLLIGCGIALSPLFACATPFAAVATLAALKLGGRDRLVVTGMSWLANQAVGYLYLGYPWTLSSGAWGIAIGVATAAATVAATGLSSARPAPLAMSLPFVAAFAVFELSLYAAGFLLPGSEGAFTPAIVGHIFLINGVTLCGILAAFHVVMLFGRTARGGDPGRVTAATP